MSIAMAVAIAIVARSTLALPKPPRLPRDDNAIGASLKLARPTRGYPDSRRRTRFGSVTSYDRPRHRTSVGFRVRTSPTAITHGTARAAPARRHPDGSQEAATAGATENSARLRREPLRIPTGRGERKKNPGRRYVGPATGAAAKQPAPKRREPMKMEKAATAYRRTIGR